MSRGTRRVYEAGPQRRGGIRIHGAPIAFPARHATFFPLTSHWLWAFVLSGPTLGRSTWCIDWVIGSRAHRAGSSVFASTRGRLGQGSRWAVRCVGASAEAIITHI